MPERLRHPCVIVVPLCCPWRRKPLLSVSLICGGILFGNALNTCLISAAQHYDVLVIEEPIFQLWRNSAYGTRRRAHGSPSPYRSCRKVFRRKIRGRTARSHRESDRPRGSGAKVFWYYTPMALAFTSDLDCDLCVYDNMDELSLFRGASEALMTLENDLFARADLVFTGGMSLYEAKRSRHRSVTLFRRPSSSALLQSPARSCRSRSTKRPFRRPGRFLRRHRRAHGHRPGGRVADRGRISRS